jgi:hypothetical protein
MTDDVLRPPGDAVVPTDVIPPAEAPVTARVLPPAKAAS